MKHKYGWRNVEGQYSFNCGVVDGQLFDSNDKLLPAFLSEIIKGLFPNSEPATDNFQVVIHFLSDGWHDEGCVSGPPEYCYPPEGEDIRTLNHTVEVHYMPINQAEYATKEMSMEQSKRCFDYFDSEINQVEINCEDDGPDYDDYDD